MKRLLILVALVTACGVSARAASGLTLDLGARVRLRGQKGLTVVRGEVEGVLFQVVGARLLKTSASGERLFEVDLSLSVSGDDLTKLYGMTSDPAKYLEVTFRGTESDLTSDLDFNVPQI